MAVSALGAQDAYAQNRRKVAGRSTALTNAAKVKIGISDK